MTSIEDRVRDMVYRDGVGPARWAGRVARIDSRIREGSCSRDVGQRMLTERLEEVRYLRDQAASRIDDTEVRNGVVAFYDRIAEDLFRVADDHSLNISENRPEPSRPRAPKSR